MGLKERGSLVPFLPLKKRGGVLETEAYFSEGA